MPAKSLGAYILHWIVLVTIAEIIMVAFNGHLPLIYIVIAALFLGGFSLRLMRLYPGEEEPLMLDLSAIIIALVFAYAAHLLRGTNYRFLLIFSSSLIIFPHLIYIIRNF